MEYKLIGTEHMQKITARNSLIRKSAIIGDWETINEHIDGIISDLGQSGSDDSGRGSPDTEGTSED